MRARSCPDNGEAVPNAAVEWGPGDNPGVRVLNLAGVGQSGWDIIEDSIIEVCSQLSWARSAAARCPAPVLTLGSERCPYC